MRNYLGLISILFFCLIIILATTLYPPFDIFSHTFSFLGTIPQTASLFNFSLIIIALLNLSYLRFMISSYQLPERLKVINLWTFYSVLFSLILVAVFPYNVNRFLHGLFASIIFFGFPVALIIFGISIHKRFPLFGKFTCFTGILIFISTFLLYRIFTISAFTEGIFLCELSIWLTMANVHSEIKLKSYRH